MTRRPTERQGSAPIAGSRRKALSALLDALDVVLEDGIAPPDRMRPDSSLRTCALELAFAEAEAVVQRLRTRGALPTAMSHADADRLLAAAASICVWGRTPGRGHDVLDTLADAVARVPGSATPLAQLA